MALLAEQGAAQIGVDHDAGGIDGFSQIGLHGRRYQGLDALQHGRFFQIPGVKGCIPFNS